jgi:hypothetical protein
VLGTPARYPALSDPQPELVREPVVRATDSLTSSSGDVAPAVANDTDVIAHP